MAGMLWAGQGRASLGCRPKSSDSSVQIELESAGADIAIDSTSSADGCPRRIRELIPKPRAAITMPPRLETRHGMPEGSYSREASRNLGHLHP